jgi:ABC-type multidrug transport system ATPase subunit
MILRVEELSVKVKKHTILSDINLTLDEGEVLCIAGRNGAGKSTLLKCLAGLLTRYSGRIIIDEGDGDARRKIGVMIDGPSLYSHLTGMENLDIIRRYHNLTSNVVLETLAIVGLSDEANKLVKFYSSGMRQRMAIAMAFIHKPKIVILDEPLNALDPEAVIGIRTIIKQLTKDFKTSFVITSHSLQEITRVFTHLAILKDGKIVMNVSNSHLANYFTFNIDPIHVNDFNVSEFMRNNNILFSDRQGSFQAFAEKTAFENLSKTFPQVLRGVDELKRASVEDVYVFANL